jgi:cardiolipin synthase
MIGRALKFAATTSFFLFVTTACATLPDTDALIARHTGQAARFESASGPLSAQKSAAILAGLKRNAGDIDILEKQIALEQSIVGSPLFVGNKVVLLQDGAATYAAMFAAIRGARDHINLESYIIDDDEVGQQFADLLLVQQSRGIQVNIIYDSVGGFNTPKAFFERLIEGGIAVLEFNPLNPLATKKEWLINNRDHRKLLVVDGRMAFIGGINISSVYSSGSGARRRPKVAETVAGNTAENAAENAAKNAAGWRDTHLQIEGPVVAELQKLFIGTWEKQRGKPLAAKDYFPALKAQGKDIVRTIGSTPDDPYSLIYLTLISAIGNAERQIQLTNAYFVPDAQLLKSLIDAAARGVDVKIILPGHSDSDITFYAGRSHYAALLKAGVKIYERRGALLHSKTASIDGVWSCVGSANLDWRSFIDNDEVNAVILGREFAGQMQIIFAKDLDASEAIDPERWEQRSLILRLKEWGASLLQRLL